MPGFSASTAAFAAAGVVLISGCAGSADAGPVVSAADLQKGLVEQLAQAGTPSTWVNCPKELAGNIGATTRCDVKFGADNTVTALLTTTKVSGDQVTWEITNPVLTADQVAQRVAGLTSAQSVNCDSGLDGRPGAWVQCRVTNNGVTLGEIVEVKDVRGLSVDLALTPLMSQQQLEESVRGKATSLFGRRIDDARCPGGLAGRAGTTVNCVVMLGDNPEPVVVTVTGAPGSAINFEVSRPTAAKPGIDLCNGCPG